MAGADAHHGIGRLLSWRASCLVRRAAIVPLPCLGGQLLREVRRRTRAVGAFPDGKSALMLAAARLRRVAGMKWGTRRYLDMNRLARAPWHESSPHWPPPLFCDRSHGGRSQKAPPNWPSPLNKSAKNSEHYLQRPGASS